MDIKKEFYPQSENLRVELKSLFKLFSDFIYYLRDFAYDISLQDVPQVFKNFVLKVAEAYENDKETFLESLNNLKTTLKTDILENHGNIIKELKDEINKVLQSDNLKEIQIPEERPGEYVFSPIIGRENSVMFKSQLDDIIERYLGKGRNPIDVLAEGMRLSIFNNLAQLSQHFIFLKSIEQKIIKQIEKDEEKNELLGYYKGILEDALKELDKIENDLNSGINNIISIIDEVINNMTEKPQE